MSGGSTQPRLRSRRSTGRRVPAAKGTELRDRIIAQFTERTTRSKQFAEAHRGDHADKSAIGAAFDSNLKAICYPIVVDHAQGCEVYDIDGNRYTDLLQGLGASLFGHNPVFVRDAIAARIAKGFALGTQTQLAGDVAARVARMTGKERVCFSNTGTEAIMTAIRLARTHTGRDRIVMFTNSYHGHSDPVLFRAPLVEYARRKVIGKLGERPLSRPLARLWDRPLATAAVPAAAGIPSGIGRDVLVLDYGDRRALDVIRAQRNRIAAVLVEPVQSRCPERKPVDFLKALRDLTRVHDIALIFDEMVTGFRLHPAGAQGLFEIDADIATYSKIVGGGLPLSIIAGSARYLDHIDGGRWRFGDDSRPEVPTTFFAGTFCKHPLALAAAQAVLIRLEEAGPGLQEGLNQRTAELVGRLNGFTDAEDIPVRFTHAGSFFAMALSESRIKPRAVNLFSYLLLCHGVFVRAGDRGGFLGTAHEGEDIHRVASTIEEGLATLRADGEV